MKYFFYFELFLSLLFIFFYLTFEYNLNKKPNYLSGGVGLLGRSHDRLLGGPFDWPLGRFFGQASERA